MGGVIDIIASMVESTAIKNAITHVRSTFHVYPTGILQRWCWPYPCSLAGQTLFGISP